MSPGDGTGTSRASPSSPSVRSCDRIGLSYHSDAPSVPGQDIFVVPLPLGDLEPGQGLARLPGVATVKDGDSDGHGGRVPVYGRVRALKVDTDAV